MKLLIVDDDHEIVSVIYETIDWNALGFDEVFYAYHAEGAKPFLRRRVDIVICDIEMPRGTGLDLIAWARDKGIESEFIFLTCHDSFSLIQEAMQYRAHSYILKPFNSSEIVQEVLKASDRIRRRENLASCETLWQENKITVEQRFWRDFMLLDSTLEMGVLNSRLENRGITIDKSINYRLALIKQTKSANAGDGLDEEISLFEYRATHIIIEHILRDPSLAGRLFSFQHHGWQYVGCIFPDPGEDDAIRRCERFVEQYRSEYSDQILCFLGEPSPLSLLPKERVRLENLSHQSYRTGMIIYRDSDQVYETPGVPLDVTRMQEYLKKGDRMALMKDIKEQLEALMAEGRLSLQVMLAIQQMISSEVSQFLRQHDLNAEFLFADSAYCYLQVNARSSTYDMIKWVNYLFSKVIRQEEDTRQESSLVSKALTYIHTHYTEDITREEVSRYVCLAPAYFAKQFKKERGITIKDYINYCRVTAARDLLRYTDMSITDVASHVGFTDSSYFTVVFKKIIGATPKEYRQNL